MQKSLDQKIADIRANPSSSKAFIIADAKDADMAFGATAPGPQPSQNRHAYNESEGHWKSLADYREQIRAVIRQGIVDIMLLSASNLEQLAMREKLFADSAITPAARANDTSDIWAVRGGKYPDQPSRAFRTATLDHIKYGRITEDHTKPVLGADLGLYSITFTNNLDWDYKALSDFHDFRIEAEKKRFRYFFEVFNPNVNPGISDKKVAAFLNDHIIRCLAGVTEVGRPLFLKIPYNGPGPLEELIRDAQKYGARVALFGRKINLSEHPLAFIEMLRRIVDGEIQPVEAVKVYHNIISKLGIKPQRTLQMDLQLTTNKMSYR